MSETRVSDETLDKFAQGEYVLWSQRKAIGGELQSQRQLLKRMAEALEDLASFAADNGNMRAIANRNARAVLAEYREAVKSGRAGSEG